MGAVVRPGSCGGWALVGVVVGYRRGCGGETRKLWWVGTGRCGGGVPAWVRW